MENVDFGERILKKFYEDRIIVGTTNDNFGKMNIRSNLSSACMMEMLGVSSKHRFISDIYAIVRQISGYDLHKVYCY